MPQVPDVGGSVVSADVYRDPARYEQERVAVLRRSWLVAARSAELAGVGDFVVYEGHGETVVISRLADGGLAAFHNVCQHRGARVTDEPHGCAERFTCPWHGWTYDQTGRLVGVPERTDFDPEHLRDLRAPAVAVDEWHGWVWINLAGNGAPPLLDWIGADIVADLGRFRMGDMVLHEKVVHDLPTNYKVVVDGFNEVYHVTELHHVDTDFTRAARATSFHLRGPNSMMFVPRADSTDRLDATLDHHRYTICHYVVFPNTVFNNNPRHIQVFQPIPLAVDRTRFICWELVYPDDGSDPDYAAYWDTTMAHWETLKGVVAEDLFVFSELDSTRHSMGYTRNVFSARECKPTVYHHTMDHMVAGSDPLDPAGWHPAAGRTDP